jgi:hypothetical protein
MQLADIQHTTILDGKLPDHYRVRAGHYRTKQALAAVKATH